jgi:hypothetical protein
MTAEPQPVPDPVIHEAQTQTLPGNGCVDAGGVHTETQLLWRVKFLN